jgi:hypothetical protein
MTAMDLSEACKSSIDGTPLAVRSILLAEDSSELGRQQLAIAYSDLQKPRFFHS